MIKALKEYQVQDAKLREIEKVLSGSEERKKTISAKKYLEGVEENVNKLDLRAAELNATFVKATENQLKLKEQQVEIAEAIERVEDEYFISINHSMTKEHYISFIAYLTSDKVQFIKLYPEGNAEGRIRPQGIGYLFIYCNKHGLMKIKI